MTLKVEFFFRTRYVSRVIHLRALSIRYRTFWMLRTLRPRFRHLESSNQIHSKIFDRKNAVEKSVHCAYFARCAECEQRRK